jgi:hypothetical protein
MFLKRFSRIARRMQHYVSPLITNLRLDPLERFHTSRGYDEWLENRVWTYFPAAGLIVDLAKSLREYPPRIQSRDFNIDEIMRVPPPTAASR